MDFIETFKDRGYLYQCTNLEGLTSLMQKEKITAYIGFDATAASLHVGHLTQIMIMRLLQQFGHKPIIIIGGTTTKIGDPSGKTELRKILPHEEIENNILLIKQSLAKFINFGDGPADAMILNNSDWLEKINYIEFLSKFGRLFSINKMLSLDIVASRLEQNQSFTFLELNYMLLQAYDFYYLNTKYNCVLQFSGSDQWGNIIMGLDLIKKVSRQECFGITAPLLTTSSGIKMGKSLKGAVWLDENLLSPYEYFQYWRNIEDLDILRFAKLFCEFSLQEIIEFEKLVLDNINEAKKQLAFRITKFCHGEEEATKALNNSINIFEKKNQSDLEMPALNLDSKILEDSVSIVQLLHLLNLTPSKTESKKLIRGAGVRINNNLVEENLIITKQLTNDNQFTLSLGKKKHYIVRFDQ